MELTPALADTLRLAVFAGLLVLLSALEFRFPRRLTDPLRPVRWPTNLTLLALGSALNVALSLSLGAVALFAAREGWGFFNHMPVPPVVAFLGSWLFLDLAIYIQHRAFHRIGWLWPLHRVHHSDVAFDVTTGLRFHPGELLLSQGYKALVVLALGAPWTAVLAFEVGLSAFALWTHANLRIPPSVEAMLRAVLVTNDLHRVHHSVHPDEQERNYGNLLSLWDRLFGTFAEAPREPHRTMTIGLTTHRRPAEQSLVEVLKQPFGD